MSQLIPKLISRLIIKTINYNNGINEDVSQQISRITEILKKKCHDIDRSVIERILELFVDFENGLPEEDKRKSQSVNKILKQIPDNIGKNHIFDSIKMTIKRTSDKIESYNNTDKQSELEAIKRNNLIASIKQHASKYYLQNDKNLIDMVLKVLENNPDEDIDSLIKRISYNSHGEHSGNKLINKLGDLELFEVNTWVGNGRVKKHIDTKYPERTHILFQDTKWCVRFKDYFDGYIEVGPLYFITKSHRPFALGHISCGFLDINDEDLFEKEYIEILPLIKCVPELYVKLIYNSSEGKFRISEPDKEIEPYILSEIDLALDYAVKILRKRWPELEKKLYSHVANGFTKSLEEALYYIKYVIKGRWSEIEEFIIKCPQLACEYAYSIIKGRWPEAEKYIIRNPARAGEYARYVMSGHWPEADNYYSSLDDSNNFKAIYFANRD